MRQKADFCGNWGTCENQPVTGHLNGGRDSRIAHWGCKPEDRARDCDFTSMVLI